MTRPADDRLVLLRLAYSEGARALDHQSTTVDSIHSRAGVLLAGASAATAFFGGAAVDAMATEAVLFRLAMAAYLLVALACLNILRPRRKWYFTRDPLVIAEGHAGRYTERESLEFLAKELKETYLKHERRIRRLGRVFTMAAAALALEVVLWAWLLATKA